MRRAHTEQVTMISQWGTLAASVMDMSTTGAQVRLAHGLVPVAGDDITLRFVDEHHIAGSVAWSGRDAIGISFDRALPAVEDFLWTEQRPDWIHATVRAARQRRTHL